jgi:hypothetical protein
MVRLSFRLPDRRKAATGSSRRLARAKPLRDVNGTGAVNYDVFCGQVIYVFSRTGGAWRWTDTSPDD